MSNLNLTAANWWEDAAQYTEDSILPEQLAGEEYWGPNGPAIVKAYADGSTQRGWGLTSKDGGPAFMARYLDGEFTLERAERGYDSGAHNLAIVMRSARIVCIDIDGKNGGDKHVTKIGLLPQTLAETSKSGTGWHLFYYVDDEWDAKEGFGEIPDKNGFVTGVDIKSVGCVYHHNTQRWNKTPIAPLPHWLREKLVAQKKEREAKASQLLQLANLDDTERMLAHANLLDELSKPLKKGSRNTTLFAIGSQLLLAEYPNWQGAVHARATDAGLPEKEADRLVSNIENYGASA